MNKENVCVCVGGYPKKPEQRQKVIDFTWLKNHNNNNNNKNKWEGTEKEKKIGGSSHFKLKQANTDTCT